jgi:hypothetical protein
MTTDPQQPTTAAATQDDSTAAGAGTADRSDAPILPEGEDVRIGPDQSDEPQAGAAEPTD